MSQKGSRSFMFPGYDREERNEFGEKSNNNFPTTKESESIFDYLSNISLNW